MVERSCVAVIPLFPVNNDAAVVPAHSDFSAGIKFLCCLVPIKILAEKGISFCIKYNNTVAQVHFVLIFFISSKPGAELALDLCAVVIKIYV
jgi:hypothetical protein